MPVRCPNCGFHNRDTARFCRRCGTRLLLPKAIAAVAAMCSNTSRLYALVFERIGGGPWVLRRTETDGPLESATDRAGFRLQEIAWDRAETRPCPHCANHALVQCGSCGGISCHPGAEKGIGVSCVWCGVAGRIDDYIRQLEGKQRL